MPTCARDRVGGTPRVAGHEPDLDARAVSSRDRVGGLGLDRVGDDDQARGRAVDRDGDGGPAAGGRGLDGVVERARSTPPPATRRRLPTSTVRRRVVDDASDAATDDRLEVDDRARSRARRASALGRRSPRRADARCRARADAGEVEHGPLVDAGRGDDLGHPRPAERQRAGLVEDDRVDAVGGLERLAAADQDAGLGPAAGADHDRRRRRQPHRAWAGDDQDGDERGEREREPRLRPEREPDRERRDGREQRPAGTNASADPVGQALDRRLAALRALHQPRRSGPGRCRARPASPA